MTAFFVTRHKGAAQWAAGEGIDAQHVSHLDLDMVQEGDTVIGTLPVSVAADVCAKGARYLHLTLNVPEALRGTELSAGDMTRLGARLEEFVVGKGGIV